MTPRIKVETIDYHRNGVAGNGFYVIKFKDGKDRRLGIVFPHERGNVAVFDRALLADDVTGNENRWRGDYYEHALRTAILEYEDR